MMSSNAILVQSASARHGGAMELQTARTIRMRQVAMLN